MNVTPSKIFVGDDISLSARMLLGAKFRSWANFPRYFPKKIPYSKNDSFLNFHP
jgi:hypothetical protein